MIYPDDRFHPVHGNDVEVAVLNNKSVNVTTMENIKSYDKYYRCVRVSLSKKKTAGKAAGSSAAKVEYFISGPPGKLIRDAITGVPLGGVVGSLAEDFYFKVRICSPEHGPEAVTLFYMNPEAFERHQYTIVDDETKSRWLEKRARM